MNPLFNDYLKLLGVREQEPTMNYLRQLIRAQQIKVPYENISKLLRRAENKHSIPDFEEFLSHLAEFNFGGTCYVQNGYFSQLLQNLGFNTVLVACSTNASAVSHAAIRLNYENENYIVDLGLFSTFTGPFLLRAGHVVEGRTRNLRDRFEAMDQFCFQTQHFRDEELSRSHISQPEPRELSYFAEPITQSFSKSSTFMSTVVTHRVFESGTISLWGRNAVIESNGQISWVKFATVNEVADFYKNQLGLPRFPVVQAIEILRDYSSVDLFASI